ncbi:MAG: hypothetical protein MHPSP_001976, partial [Paramarteilia canceri]
MVGQELQALFSESLSRDCKLFISIVEQNLWPENGLSRQQILSLLHALSKMDSNNEAQCGSNQRVGLGEREGRIFSNLVYERWYGFAHGIGRSGNLTEAQPKALGSSIVQQLANKLVLHALKIRLKHIVDCFISPVATGMSLLLCILATKKMRTESKYVIMTRVDQKCGLKAIYMSGLKPIVIENILV